jgi:hypothetical protein
MVTATWATFSTLAISKAAILGNRLASVLFPFPISSTEFLKYRSATLHFAPLQQVLYSKYSQCADVQAHE